MTGNVEASIYGELTTPGFEHARDGIGRAGTEFRDGVGRSVDLVLGDAACHEMLLRAPITPQSVRYLSPVDADKYPEFPTAVVNGRHQPRLNGRTA